MYKRLWQIHTLRERAGAPKLLPIVKAVECDVAIKTPKMQSSKRTEIIVEIASRAAVGLASENSSLFFQETEEALCLESNQPPSHWGKLPTMTAEDHIARMLRGEKGRFLDQNTESEQSQGMARPPEYVAHAICWILPQAAWCLRFLIFSSVMQRIRGGNDDDASPVARSCVS
jgi:hypothetical protein